MDAIRTAAVFEQFQLNLYSEEWVKTCWDNEFVDLNTLPVEGKVLLTENDHLIELLRAAAEVITTWLELNNQNENGEGFWSILVESDISHKSLVTLLAYLTYNGGKVSVSFTEKAAGILSASVYLKLIALPDNSDSASEYCDESDTSRLSKDCSKLLHVQDPRSSAFKIYNPELFLQACRLLNKWNKSECDNKSKHKRNTRSPKTSQKSGKRGKRQKLCLDSTVEIAEGEKSDELEADVELSAVELQKLDNLMTCLLQSVIVICETYSLRQSEYTATQLLSVLVDLTRVNYNTVKEEMGQWNSKNCSPGILAYKAVYLLCQPFHGHVTVLISEVCKLLLNHLLMLDDGKQLQHLDSSALRVRNQALQFIRYLAKEFNERCTLSVKTLIQHISFKVPDRIEYRTHSAQTISELLDCLPDLEYAKLLEWLKKLSKQKKVNQRSVVIEVMLDLLEKPERVLSVDVPKDLMNFATHKSMVCTMLSRCSDSNASVRSRALVGFSSCVNSKHSDIISTIKEIITPVATRGRPTAKHFMPTPQLAIRMEKGSSNEGSSEIESVDVAPDPSEGYTHELIGTALQIVPTDKSFCNIELTPGFNPYLPDTEGVVSMFRRRVLDSKVVVRKSALQALQRVVHFEAPLYQLQDLVILQERCADPALSVRKQAAQSLFELLQTFPRDKQIQKAWVFGLLPQVMDRETSVQEKCFDVLEEMILQNIKPVGKTCDSSIEWELLNIVADETSEKLRRYFQKTCQYWSRSKKFKTSIIEALQSHINGPNDNAAWMFLAEIAKTPVKMKHDLVISHWKTVMQSVCDDAVCSKWNYVLAVLGSIAKSIPVESTCDILAALLSGCCVITRTNADLGEKLMADCDRYISGVVLNNQNENVDEEQLIKYIFTLGEVCQRCPTRMPKRAALLIQSIVASPCIGSISNSGDDGNQYNDVIRSGHLERAEASHGSQPGSKETSHDSQDGDSQPDSYTSQSHTVISSQPLSQFRGSKMSSKLRAHAFITLGKLCLVDESLAKKAIAALARELEESDSPAVRNNVVIIMGDLTIRYTTLVDRYVTNIAACLKDPSPLVRKNTLTILTRLLQEEYVKWKGVLFFRYITTILDNAVEIKNLAEFCLEHLLLQKHPSMFFHPFLECIFHFNNYQVHTVYNKFKQTEREKQKFSLAGRENVRRRLYLYSFMLEHMTDEQRFKITDKINKEILSAVADQMIPLDNEGSQILHDALAILSSKEIKLSTLRSKSVEDIGGEEGADMAQIVTVTAKKALISQVIKRNVIENVVPVVISLKHMLEKSRSPLLKYLMMYLRELFKDYKNEIKDILSVDRQLVQEIEFDLRSFENQETDQESYQMGTPTSFHAAIPPVSRQASKQSSRAASPVINVNPVFRERTDIINIESRRTSTVTSLQNTSIAILDAAKKALNRVEQLRQSGSTFSPRSKRSENLDNIMSPVRNCQQERAVSTPADGLYNITFGADVNVTMMPPSPISSVVNAMNNGQICLSPTLRVQRQGSKTVIHMTHPREKDSDPVKWNIQSPRATNMSVSGSDTPSRKFHMTSRVGLRRSGRQQNI